MKTLSNLFAIIILSLLTPSFVSAKANLQVVDFTAQELKNIQGHYSTIYGYVYINVKGKYVSSNFDGKHIQLVKKTDGHFYPRYKLLRIFPINISDVSFSLKVAQNKSQKKIQILMHQKKKKQSPIKALARLKDRPQTVAQKFIPLAIPQYWKQRLGAYKATRIKGDSNIKKIRLNITNGILVAYINNITKPYPLLATSTSKLYSPSAGHNKSQPINITSSNKTITLQYAKNTLLLNKI